LIPGLNEVENDEAKILCPAPCPKPVCIGATELVPNADPNVAGEVPAPPKPFVPDAPPALKGEAEENGPAPVTEEFKNDGVVELGMAGVAPLGTNIDARNGFGPPVVCGRSIGALEDAAIVLENAAPVGCEFRAPKPPCEFPKVDIPVLVAPVGFVPAEKFVLFMKPVLRVDTDPADPPIGVAGETGGRESTRFVPKDEVGLNGLMPPKPVACGCNGAGDEDEPSDSPDRLLVKLDVPFVVPVWLGSANEIFEGDFGESGRANDDAMLPIVLVWRIDAGMPVACPLNLDAGGDGARNAPVASCCSVGAFGTGGTG